MMRLVSLHLSNDRILWGHVLLEDTENPDAHLAQILVRAIDIEPGYELYDRTNTVLSDLTVPAVREANRIVQTLLIPASEIARREKAVRAVIHSGYLEGFPDDMPWQSQLWMYAEGKSPANNSPRTPTKADRSPPTRPLRCRSGGRTRGLVADHTSPHPPEPPQHHPHRTRSRRRPADQH